MDVQAALRKTSSRGPDDSRIVNTGNGWLGFNRFLESNIRATGDADLSGSAKMPVSAESADKKGEQKGPDRRGGGSDRFSNRIELPGWNS